MPLFQAFCRLLRNRQKTLIAVKLMSHRTFKNLKESLWTTTSAKQPTRLGARVLRRCQSFTECCVWSSPLMQDMRICYPEEKLLALLAHILNTGSFRFTMEIGLLVFAYGSQPFESWKLGNFPSWTNPQKQKHRLTQQFWGYDLTSNVPFHKL